MRAAILIDSLARGGAEHQALNATHALARRGCDATLIHYHPALPGRTYEDHPAVREGRVLFLPKGGSAAGFIWRLSRLLSRNRFDVVHGFKSIATIYACMAGRLARVPVVIGGCRAEYEDGGAVRLMHLLLRSGVDGWVVNSRAVAQSLVARVGVSKERCFVVTNGVAPEEFRSALSPVEARRRLGLDDAVHAVSIIARLRAQKNHRLFLAAAGRILVHRQDVRFLIVGDGELRSDLEKFAADMGLLPHVRFLGERTDIADILAATDVSVMTSRYEGLANALIESMCAGVPIVTTDYSGHDELLSDGREGYVVPRDDEIVLAERIIHLLDSPDLRRRMGQEGRGSADVRFSVNAMADSLIAVYDGCLARRAARE
jgi:glycosyltransferase involved in cell wall biosynthesis